MSKDEFKSIYDFSPEYIASLETELIKAYYARSIIIFYKAIKKYHAPIYRAIGPINFIKCCIALLGSCIDFILNKIYTSYTPRFTVFFLDKFVKHISKLDRNIPTHHVATLIYRFWVIDRQLKGIKSGVRIKAMQEAFAILYGLSAENFHTFASNYCAAALLCDRYEYKELKNVDWEMYRDYLVKAYTSLHEVVNNKQTL